MKNIFLCCLLLRCLPTPAQSINAVGGPRPSFGAPYFVRPDSTQSAAGIIAAGSTCYVEQQTGSWLKINYDGKFGYYALAHTISVANAVGGDIAAPFDGANALVLHTPEPPEAAWVGVSRFLLAQGYTVAQRDKDLLSITTNPQALGGGVAMTVSAVAMPEATGSMVLVTAFYTSAANDVLVTNAGIAHLRVKKPVFDSSRTPWAKLSQLAKRYPGARIGYLQQP